MVDNKSQQQTSTEGTGNLEPPGADDNWQLLSSVCKLDGDFPVASLPAGKPQPSVIFPLSLPLKGDSQIVPL